MGDLVWSLLPGEQTLTPTAVTNKRSITQRGFVNAHTLQGTHQLDVLCFVDVCAYAIGLLCRTMLSNGSRSCCLPDMR